MDGKKHKMSIWSARKGADSSRSHHSNAHRAPFHRKVIGGFLCLEGGGMSDTCSIYKENIELAHKVTQLSKELTSLYDSALKQKKREGCTGNAG